MEEFVYLPKNYEYSNFKSEPNGTTSFRIKSVFSQEDCIKWLNDFGEEQLVTWKILTTFPRAGRVNSYKSVWRCQHNVYPKIKAHNSKQDSKHTECQAKIKLTLKRYVKGSRSKDPEYHLNKDWPFFINLQPVHNHPLEAASAVVHRPMGNEVKEKLLGLFHCGHSASSAREALKLELFINDVENYPVYSADGKYIPSLSKIQHVLDNEYNKQYGSKSDNNLEILEKMIQEFNENTSDGKAIFGVHNNHKYIALCSSIMARVHKYVPQSGEMIFVDAAGGMDRHNSRVYFFMTPTPAGALPLGAVITDSEETELFSVCLQNLYQCFPENPFFGKLAPDVIMTDDDLKERKALNKIFPNSKILLCQFHVLKSVWKWILQNIPNKEKRQELYYTFKKIMHEKDVINAEQIYTFLLQNCPFPNFVKYISTHKWPTRDLWMSAYRRNLPIRGNNTNNYVEVVFRILKDIILDRTKSYNIVQLTDFILSKYECYMQRRCIEYSNGRYLKSALKKYIGIKSTINVNEIKQNNDGTYVVPSETTANATYYIVNAEEGFCNCTVGSTGQLCKHISIVLNHFKINDTYFTCSADSKSILFKVATGKEVSKKWLMELNSGPEKHADTHNEKSKEKSDKIIDKTVDPLNVDDDIYRHRADKIKENLKKLDLLVERIKNGIAQNVEIFAPALEKMVDNTEKYVRTDNALISTMHTFGKYSGLKITHQQNKKGIRHQSKIGVQPTSVGRRKQGTLGGKRAKKGGRPVVISNPLKRLGHDYTSFNSLPPKKKKLPHNLTRCVEINKFVP